MTQKKSSQVLSSRRITLPTSFSDGFITDLAELNSRYSESGGRVFELYGSFQHGSFHSARPAKYLPLISRSEFQKHVRLALDQDIAFNYLLNSPSYANFEYTHDGRQEFEELLQFLCDCGVASVTVTAPYLVDIIKSSFPELEVVVSTIGYVGAKRGINQFEEIGASRIVLDVEVNRDFRFLRRVTPGSRVDLEIVVNPVCLYQCHFKFNHYCTAASGGHIHKDGCGHPYNQYYLNWCYLEKLKNPGEFMRSPWVRPEDLHFYEEIGLHHFKIAGRGLESGELLDRARFYLQGEFKGNLLALLGWPHWLQFRKQADGTKLDPLEISLENDELSGFLDYFHRTEPDCRLGCEGCGHCDRWAAKHLKTNGPELLKGYIATMEANIRRLVNHIPTAEETLQQQKRWNEAAASQGHLS
ncbi:collagenase-like protease [Desulfocapsa sulfexigens DSM 10523]|uniref:Collagenase-like protease n=1 Tax=Desulfocapsa sulfexigens (strain DSM 10523 / SB164P1) TaxID=1167006 RepID=M1PLW0_DESSD|nr:U32 family peptidase [Desulfocapsa sulfexigens]AGF77436.1 collagenase-like protease [Desulfocapsa sulfexigens DSM 10523]